jgi:hypothetical protein
VIGLAELNAFDVANAIVTVWTFKKSVPSGAPPVFTGRWLGTDDALDNVLRDAVSALRAEIVELQPYSLLAQNNEGSALIVAVEATHAPLFLAQAADPAINRKVKSLKEINNSAFYVVKFAIGERALYAVRKTDDSWRSRKAHGAIRALYADEGLTLDQTPHFNISRHVDFCILDDTIFVLSKGRFESLLNYKAEHLADFAALQAEPEFLATFAALDELQAYVGSNKIQLRRTSAIRERAYYKDAVFMNRLRQHHASLGLNIVFDANGLIVPTAATCRDIFQALLDHRLNSRLTEAVYDVENTVAVV